MSYRHTQVGWPVRLSLFGGALVLVAAGALTPEPAPIPWVMLIAATVMIGAGFVFGSLSIRLDGDRLHWHFGAGWPRRSIALESVSSVELTRTRFWEGWGIHATRRGWLYNVSGYDAVLIRLCEGSTLLLGTDEPRRLKDTLDHALKSRRST
jgi:hypothetical protein